MQGCGGRSGPNPARATTRRPHRKAYPMRPLRRPTRATIHYHGRSQNFNEHDVTLSINGIRYRYSLASQQCDTVEHLAKHVSVGKALAFAKKHATATIKLDNVPIAMQTLLRHRGAQASRAKRMKVTLPNV